MFCHVYLSLLLLFFMFGSGCCRRVDAHTSAVRMEIYALPFHVQIGNILVCIAVYANTSMRTITNIFIVNLAVADLLVIILCLPPSVVWDITETWFLGEAMCKVILYLQVRSFYTHRRFFLKLFLSFSFFHNNIIFCIKFYLIRHNFLWNQKKYSHKWTNYFYNFMVVTSIL